MSYLTELEKLKKQQEEDQKKKKKKPPIIGDSYTDEYKRLMLKEVAARQELAAERQAKRQNAQRIGNALGIATGVVGDIAPVRTPSVGAAEKKRRESEKPFAVRADKSEATLKAGKQIVKPSTGTYFQKGAFEDGEIINGVAATLLDVGTNATAGVIDMTEQIYDGALWFALKTLLEPGAQAASWIERQVDPSKERQDTWGYKKEQQARTNIGNFIKADTINGKAIGEHLSLERGYEAVTGTNVDKDSAFGDKMDSLAQSAGQVAAQAVANYFVPGIGIAALAASSFGGEVDNALNNGATLEEAGLSGLITSGTEVATEWIGGIKFGGKTLSDAAAKALGRKISSSVVRNAAKIGLDMAGEGAEEVISGYVSAVGQKLTYMDKKEISELFSSEDALDSFIGGVILGGGSGSINIVQSKKHGVDYVTGRTKNEQAVFDKEYQDRIAEAEKALGKELTGKEKTKIYDEIANALAKGYISTDTIESVLGGETYKGYQSMVEQEKALKSEIEALENIPDNSITVKQRERLNEARQQLKELDLKGAKSNLFSEVDKLTANDAKLRESYNEKTRRGQAFEADLSKYDAKQQETVKRAVDSGILNNTNRTHEFVDLIAKLSADKGVSFDFTNNQRLKESGFALDGVVVNGFVNENGVTININSAKALNSVVGHEITHVLEGTDLYAPMAELITQHAKSKGEYDSRLEAITKLYEGKNANIEQELVADLVGDYLFSDPEFIRTLSTEHRNVFQKLYDEIKYLCKVATAGSKEARELEKVKKVFAEAYRAETKNPTADGGVRYSLGDINYPRKMIGFKDTTARRAAEDETVTSLVRREKVTTIIQKDIPAEVLNANWSDKAEARSTIKGILKQFLGEDAVFNLGDESAIAYLTSTGIDHTLAGENTESKAAALSKFYELVSNAEYSYSSLSDEHSKTEGREDWDYFVSVAEVEGGGTVPLVFAIRSIDQDVRSQIYNIATKKNPVIPRGDGTQKKSANAHPSYGDSPSLDENVPQETPNVNNKNSLSAEDSTAPVRGEIYGKDIALAPVREDIAQAKSEPSLLEQGLTAIADEVKKASTEPKQATLLEQALTAMAQQSEDSGIRDQLRSSQAALNALPSAADIHIPEDYAQMDITGKKNWVIKKLEQTGYKVTRKGFGIIDFAKKRLKSAFNYFEKGSVEEAAFEALPYVLENGIEISTHNQHKGRDYGTTTIAAPITINGTRGNMAVVVKQTTGNYYKVHRILTPDGSVFVLPEIANEAESTPAGEVPETGSLATPKDSASVNSIPQSEPVVNQDNMQTEDDPLYGPWRMKDPLDIGVEKLYRMMLREQISEENYMAQLVKADRLYQERGEFVEAALERVREAYSQRSEPVVNQEAPTDIPAEQDKNVFRGNKNKLKNIQSELDTNRQLMAEADRVYAEKIAKAQAELDSKKKKDTKTAENLKRRIERLKRLQADINADYSKRIRNLERMEKLAKEGKPTSRQEHQAMIISGIRSELAKKGIDLDEMLEKAERMHTIAINDTTPVRVNDKTFGYEAGEVLNDLTFYKVGLNEADGIKWLNEQVKTIRELSKKYNIKPGSKESSAAQMYAEGFYVNEKNEIISYGDAELAKDFPDVKVQDNIKALAKDPTIRQIYDDTLALINESRTRNAYPEIPRLDNYFLHFRAMEDAFSKLGLPFNPDDIKAKDLPTDLNGGTIDLKPGQPYFASAKHREGKRTSFDLFGGLERYLNSAKNQIFHIDDIQTMRALRNYIADAYGQAHGLDDLDALDPKDQPEQIRKVYSGHLSNYAAFLNEYANHLAGKTALMDRTLEGLIGRRGIQLINTFNSQAGKNQVGFSVSSAATNFIPLMEVTARVPKQDVIRAYAQTVSNMFRKDGFVESNHALVRRRGIDRFSRTHWEKASDAGYVLMSAVDNFTSEVIVRARYNELTRGGMGSEQAHIKAGEWAMRVMGDRSLGQTPLLYNSKMLGLFTKYQLEVRNQLDSQFYDVIQEEKANSKDIESTKVRNAKTAAKIASKMAQIAVFNHLFGTAFEAVAGYNPAFDIISTLITLFGLDDDEDSEDTFGDNIEQAFQELLGDLPYTSLITDGGRIPMSDAFPLEQLVMNKDEYGNPVVDGDWGWFLGRVKTAGEALPYLLPGGYGQAKKTVKGIGMFTGDKPVSGSYTTSGNLRFPVKEDIGSVIQAAMFGQYASKNARDYFDNDRSALKPDQIQEFKDLDIPIQQYWEIREGLAKCKTAQEKFDYVAGLDLPTEKKNILINNAVERKESVDLQNYDQFGTYEEFDFSIKNPGKYEFFRKNNISYKDYSAQKDAYNWAYENPEKYTMSKAISSDFVTYYGYKTDLSKLDSKDETGETVSGLKKKRVTEYINNLDIDYGSKIILYRSMYDSAADCDMYNGDIVEYLNSREDISYTEMVTILKELGFEVSADGRITW